MAKEECVVELYYTACTIGEAVCEINIALQKAGLPSITSDNCIDESKAEHEDDWFEDYNFTFKTVFEENKEEVESRLSEAGLDFDFEDVLER